MEIIENDYKHVDVSVRDLVEFIMRSGDLDNRGSYQKEMDAMRQGTKLHKKIQKSMPLNYSAEVSLKQSNVIFRENKNIEICVEGRADGLVKPDLSESTKASYMNIDKDNYKENISDAFIEKYNSDIKVDSDKEFDSWLDGKVNFDMKEIIDEADTYKESNKVYIVDEIKCVVKDVASIKCPVTFHRAQAMCYAYMYAIQNKLDFIAIRITYCHIESETKKYFGEIFSFDVLEKWYNDLLYEYAKWVVYELKWQDTRDESLKKLEFPFEYRAGQKKLAGDVYRTIMRDKRLFIQAPTGVGKTISTVFPTVKAMGEGLVDKIFYLTAKTITRTAAEDTFMLLKKKDSKLKFVTLTAKDKICILDKADCNPDSCERAKGHFDRVNEAVYDLITSENDVTRELILEYASKHNVCPFEMSLDVSLWVDVVICDYNYAFDPNVYLRRFFENDTKKKYVFLIDEAHNLVERANEMFSATLYKDRFLEAKSYVKKMSLSLVSKLDLCNKALLKLKRECDDFEIIDDFGDIGGFALELFRLMSEFDKFFREYANFDGKDEVLQLYFDVRQFVNIYDMIDDDYLIYTDYNEKDEFRITLQCMNPSRNISDRLRNVKSTIMFSATFLPIKYYMEQLAGREDDYAVYAPSPFDTNKRLIMIANDVSTKYTRRNKTEYEKIASYINDFVKMQKGNYMVFFPSYAYMDSILEIFENRYEETYDKIMFQTSDMNELDREEFIERFKGIDDDIVVGFCVLGGIFSEGIDLKGEYLIGAVVVGTGLPMVCNQREIFRGYYDRYNKNGFDYAYRYTGMNKVLQAGGRVIRTMDDVGAILLLDERFLAPDNQRLLPREWFPYEVVNINSMKERLKVFWDRK